MSIRQMGLDWLKQTYGEQRGRIAVSKYYNADESRTKAHVWWLEMPSTVISEEDIENIHLICQKESSEGFYYLQIPIDFMRSNRQYFNFRSNGEILSLIISAEDHNKFTEVRGKGNINFSTFLQ